MPTKQTMVAAGKALPPGFKQEIDLPSGMLAAARRVAGTGMRVGRPLIYASPQVENFSRQLAPNSVPLDGKNRMALHSIVKGHEMDELSLLPRASTVTMNTGHASPAVIFRENNRVATLPKEYLPAGETMRRAREFHENKELFQPLGLQYGDRRYSRHAIKRMTEALERRGVAMRAPNAETIEQHYRQYGAPAQPTLPPPRRSTGPRPPPKVDVQEVPLDELPPDIAELLRNGL